MKNVALRRANFYSGVYQKMHSFHVINIYVSAAVWLFIHRCVDKYLYIYDSFIKEQVSF